MAEFKEIVTMHVHSKQAMHNAKAKAHWEEQCSKEIDLLKHLQHIPPEAIVLEFENWLAEKNEEITQLQGKLARMEIQKMEVEKELEQEKTEWIKAECNFLATQEKILCQQCEAAKA